MTERKPAVLKAAPAILGYGLAVASVALGAMAALLLEHYQFRGVEYPLFLFAIAVTVCAAPLS
jgi:ABC-type Fe3+ transport system permease subunit